MTSERSTARRWVAHGWQVLVLLLWATLAPAQGLRDFDHVRTGFPLTGLHAGERCESCHVDGVFKGTPRDCQSCHSSGARWARANVVKPQNHLPTTLACDACHGTLSFAGARFSHASVAPGSCGQCHNGLVTDGKPPRHVATTASCDTCHRTSAWRPAAGFSHAGVAPGTCSNCHNGSTATGRTPQHIPYQALAGTTITNCDSCHKAGFSAWTPARFHAAVSLSTQCATCHTGSYPPAVGKPGTQVHVGATTCESCHKSTASWTSVSFGHTAANAVGTGTCDGCHNGGTAKGKPATHIPVVSGPTKCDACHRSQASWTASTTMNHGVVAASSCKSCHNGSYVSQGVTGALAKPANHIPEATQLLNGAAMDCNACHKSTTAWSAVMNHNGSLGGGAGWCKGCHLSGSNYLGSMDRKSLTHQKKTPPPLDCSEAGCHRPLGNKGAAYTNWD